MLLLSGLLTFVLGVMIWVIGPFAGLDLAFYGLWIVSLALAVRRLPSAA